MIVVKTPPRLPESQRGIVLIVGLLLLLAMTLIGVTAMKTTTLDERIAANTQFKAEAFQASESILTEVLDYNEVSTCAFNAGDCGCRPEDLKDLDSSKLALCQQKHWLMRCEADAEKDPACPPWTKRVPASAGMKFEGEMPVYGNSIGSGGLIVGKVVEIQGRVDWKDTNAKAKHNLAVGVIGLKNNQ